jgi:hypothetical protein
MESQMFTRQEVCTLTEIPVERIKSLVRRQELPTAFFLVPSLSDTRRDQIKERGWNRFSALEVFSIAVQESLFRQIGYADGLSAETASRIAGNNAHALVEVLSSPSKVSRKDKWVGYAGSEREGTDAENPGGRNIFGTLEDILKTLQRGDDGHVRLFLANADAVLREVQARAKKHLKIDFIASALTELMDEPT